MLKRSNHIPMLIRMEMMNSAMALLRIFQRHSGMGAITLQNTIRKKAICGKPNAPSSLKGSRLPGSPKGRK